MVSGNLVNYYVTFGAEATAFTINYMGVEFLTVNGTYHFIWGDTATFVQNISVTNYYPLSGRCLANTTESTFQYSHLTATLSNLEIFLQTNAVTATSTLKLRKNGGNGNQTISIAASTTGYFEDTTNTDSILATDEVNYQLITGGTGTSMTIISMGSLATGVGSASPGFPALPPGTRLLSLLGVGV